MGDLKRYAAANARVRTLLPTLLGRGGLENLYTYPSTAAIQEAILRTDYAPGVSPGLPLEVGLRGRLALIGRALLGLMGDPERGFLRQYLLRYEVENLKLIVRAVHANRPWSLLEPHVLPLPGIETVDRRRLAEARDLNDLADRLRGTLYEPAVHGALHRVEAAGPGALEVSIELDHYERLWTAAGGLRAADALWAHRLLGTLFDILNLEWIAHYRGGLRLSPEETLNYTLREGRWVTPDVRYRLAEEPMQSWDLALAGTPYASLLGRLEEDGFGARSAALWRVLAAEIQRAFSAYPFQVGVPLGLLMAMEIEIRDLGKLCAAKDLCASAAEVLDRLASVRV